MTDKNTLLKSLHNALPESAQGGVKTLGGYVNRAEDAERDPVAKLIQQILWQDSSRGSYLFSGLRGAGKTTELTRLVSELRDQGIAAFYCDASAYLNLNDPQLSLAELLMTALAGLADAVRTEHGKDSLANSIWARTKSLFNADVSFKPKLKAGTGPASLEIEASLKENPDFRKQLREFAQGSADFYVEANTFAEEVARIIRQKTECEKIVLVVDSLERLSAPSGDEAKLFDSLKEIFFNEPDRLRFDSITVVYSAPPYLDPILPNARAGFDDCIALPNFKVIEKPTPGNEIRTQSPEGIAKMVEIVDKRFPDWESVFARPVVEHFAWMSGGNVRSFFSLLRTCARKAALSSNTSLPISTPDDPAVINTLSEAAQPLQWLTGPDREWLKIFMDGKETPSERIRNIATDLPSIIRLFDHSLVLNYQNGSIWYQVPEIVYGHV